MSAAKVAATGTHLQDMGGDVSIHMPEYARSNIASSPEAAAAAAAVAAANESARHSWREHVRERAVVIGGGPSLRAPLGELVDEFGTVVRVNNFTLAHPRETGARTTHVVMHKNTKGTSSLSRVLGALPRERILLAQFGEGMEVVKRQLSQPGHSGASVDRITALETDYYLELTKRTHAALRATTADPEPDCDDKAELLKRPLTGTIAIEWALRHIRARPIYVVGFDMTIGAGCNSPATDAYEHAKYDGPEHAAPETMSKEPLKIFHNVAADRAYLHKLLKEGSIAHLDSLIG
mmetsp:Transcript_6989/g.19032  ORF Transcript_6989/g.19032 Transcript_6989/m.19032 type:complete len:293 (-) Transcript_6989:566-1444(-)